jgi:hypothetical protein
MVSLNESEYSQRSLVKKSPGMEKVFRPITKFERVLKNDSLTVNSIMNK